MKANKIIKIENESYIGDVNFNLLKIKRFKESSNVFKYFLPFQRINKIQEFLNS